MSSNLGSQSRRLRKAPAEPRQHLTSTIGEVYKGSGPGADARTTADEESPSAPKKRHSFRNLSKHESTTYFDSPEWRKASSFGLWVLFWTVVGISSLRTLLMNMINTGYPMNTHILNMLTKDAFHVALTDLVMYLCMYMTFFMQRLIAWNWLSYDRYGWILQHVWQAVYLWTFMGVSRYLEFSWIARIFLVLHSLTMVMKQYSYATYNAHLKRITQELQECQALCAERSKTNGSDTDVALKGRIEFCRDELDLQSKTLRYPANITVTNFFWFTMFPTVVYQLEYPRSPRIRWGFLLSKILAVFGILFLLVMESEQYLYPLAIKAMSLRNTSFEYRWRECPKILLDLIPPFLVCYLLVFYLIWDAVLNCIAELTWFNDREFYRDWWNSSSWDKFARDWNVPVHNFLLRHVYFSSISTLKLSKHQATILTFVLSALVHELTMFVIFGRVRGYLLTMQLSQLPLELVCQTRFMRKRPVVGIMVFWVGICLGPSVLCFLYLTY